MQQLLSSNSSELLYLQNLFSLKFLFETVVSLDYHRYQFIPKVYPKKLTMVFSVPSITEAFPY